jgi:hypothetical protein
MKTSNKLLLGIFLSILLLTTTIQLMVFAKYKRGDYTPFHREEFYSLNKFTLPPVRFVSITGLGNCVISNSDSTRLEVQDYKDSQIVYSVQNETLIINVKNIANRSDNKNEPLSYKLVNVYVPASVLIKAASSHIRLAGAPDSANAPSFNVQLESGSNLGVYNKNQEDADMYFNRLQVVSESSNIQLDDHIIINSLQLDRMVSSELDDKNALLKSITIHADDNSKVNLSGKNVKALK